MLLIPAYAKVNLCLAVRGRRPDGYHDIDSVATAIDWHDLVGLAVEPASTPTVRLRVSLDGSTIGDDADNLAARAARGFAALAGPLSVNLWLYKRIPVAAGLGGGSADAAAVLRGLNTLLTEACARTSSALPAPLDLQTLRSLAASLGSDVPLALAGGAQRMRGRGGELVPIAVPSLHLAVAVAGASSTAATYAATMDFDYDDGPCVDRVASALEAGRLPRADDLGSSLEQPACRAHPLLDERLTALRAAVPEVRWHLTGSGGAAFAVADGASHAEELAGCARAFGFVARACRSIGPSPVASRTSPAP